MEELKFSCPKCKCTLLEEVMEGVTVFNNMEKIFDTEYGEKIEWGDCDHEDGHIDRFQCNECGYHLEDKDGFVVNDYEGLLEWLKNPTDYLEVTK